MKSFTNQAPPPVREVANKSIYTLKTQQNKLEQASFRLKERDRILFETCMGALKKNNKEKAAMCATEIAEVRKLVKFLYNVQLAIERVILRLETIKELGDIVADLKPALRLLQNVSQELFQVLPDVSTELNNVNSAIQDTLQQTKLNADENLVPVGRKTEAGEEILKEVSCFMEQTLSESLPEPPVVAPLKEKAPQVQKIPQAPIREMVALTASSSQVFGQKTIEQSGFDPEKTLFSYKKSEIKEFSVKVEKTLPDLEEILLEYVRKTNGEIDLGRCSSELQTSNEEIERALENLGSKGKIKIELRSPE
ncbi:MAG: Snf7 family protein [Nitrososphaerota archaeon]|jgi:division protein CdvB (Snf7/Vps24/ESCRT-III family)|nr:Snf7 family protein [Nitrososphaerota archaeon]